MTKILFFGTPDFAIPSLKKLLENKDFYITVLSQQDKLVGRKKILTAPPIAQYAIDNNLELLQPKNLDPLAIEQFEADLAIVVAYGKIIPENILNIPKFGFINLHPSLLPDLRGPSPMQYALLNGYINTGVTIMKLDQGMDSGPILAQEKVQIDINDTYITLSEKCAQIGANLLVKTTKKYLKNQISPIKQDDSKATFSKIIKREDGLVNLEKIKPQKILNMLQAFTPWPGIFYIKNNKRYKILSGHIKNKEFIIDEIQPEGKKPMKYEEFLKGNNEE